MKRAVVRSSQRGETQIALEVILLLEEVSADEAAHAVSDQVHRRVFRDMFLNVMLHFGCEFRQGGDAEIGCQCRAMDGVATFFQVPLHFLEASPGVEDTVNEKDVGCILHISSDDCHFCATLPQGAIFSRPCGFLLPRFCSLWRSYGVYP